MTKRDRSLITVTALIAGGNNDQLRFHLPHARHNGAKVFENEDGAE